MKSFFSSCDTPKPIISVEGREFEQFKPVLRLLRDCFGELPVQQFGPKVLKSVRREMITKVWSRKVINRRITSIRTMFKWAESEELVPSGITHALATVSGLKPVELGVRESTGVEPAFWDQLEKVLPYCPTMIQTMLQLQYLTGMRSCEVRIMRMSDINQENEYCWHYCPATHKNAWRENGQKRVIPFGPKCQALLQTLMHGLEGGEFNFDPSRSTRQNQLGRERDTSDIQRSPPRQPTRCYSSNTYAQAISRAYKKANIKF